MAYCIWAQLLESLGVFRNMRLKLHHAGLIRNSGS